MSQPIPGTELHKKDKHSLLLVRAYYQGLIPADFISHIISVADSMLEVSGLLTQTQITDVGGYVNFVKESFCAEGKGSVNSLGDYAGQQYVASERFPTNMQNFIMKGEPLFEGEEKHMVKAVMGPRTAVNMFASSFIRGVVNDSTIEVIAQHCKDVQFCAMLERAQELWQDMTSPDYATWSSLMSQLLMAINRQVIAVGETREEVGWPTPTAGESKEAIMYQGVGTTKKRGAEAPPEDSSMSPSKKGREGDKERRFCKFDAAGSCLKGKDCDWQHEGKGEESQRGMSRGEDRAGRKGACFQFKEEGRCMYGASCKFDHARGGGGGLGERHECKDFSMGRCYRGNQCKFRHNRGEGRETFRDRRGREDERRRDREDERDSRKVDYGKMLDELEKRGKRKKEEEIVTAYMQSEEFKSKLASTEQRYK
jgi:hypothetical protein